MFGSTKKHFPVLVAVAFFASSSAFAQGVCSTGFCIDKVDKVMTWSGGTFWVYSDSDTTQLDCGASETDQTKKKIILQLHLTILKVIKLMSMNLILLYVQAVIFQPLMYQALMG